MPNILKTIAGLLLLFALLASCSEEQKDQAQIDDQVQETANPNGDSELTLLMRQMFDEAAQIKQQIAQEDPIAFKLNHENLLTAQATQPERIASPQYESFAHLYLQSVKNLQKANPEQKANAYDMMLASCVNCHKTYCPGPLTRIYQLQ
jgi:nitrous oxide reductase accessory protein NosL